MKMAFYVFTYAKDTATVYICVELYIIYHVVLVFTLLYTLVMIYICLYKGRKQRGKVITRPFSLIQQFVCNLYML